MLRIIFFIIFFEKEYLFFVDDQDMNGEQEALPNALNAAEDAEVHDVDGRFEILSSHRCCCSR